MDIGIKNSEEVNSGKAMLIRIQNFRLTLFGSVKDLFQKPLAVLPNPPSSFFFRACSGKPVNPIQQLPYPS